MTPVRVLVVDDSSFVRRVLTSALEDSPAALRCTGAGNGRIALSRIESFGPDIIILDINMPEMDGLRTLEELSKHHPSIPVIMFSVLTERGADATLQALFRGARDYVTKPRNMSDSAEAIRMIRKELLPRILALAGKETHGSEGTANTRIARKGKTRPEIILIASSTGGPVALAKLLETLPEEPRLPLLIVQHMPKLFTEQLARQLSSRSGIDIREASNGEDIRAGRILLAPGGYHMRLAGRMKSARVVLDDGPPVNSCRPSADVLFSSAHKIFGGKILAVVLTGMGRDGMESCRTIRDSGGEIWAQDRASSVVWGMPGHVVEEGLTSLTGNPGELGAMLAEILREPGCEQRR